MSNTVNATGRNTAPVKPASKPEQKSEVKPVAPVIKEAKESKPLPNAQYLGEITKLLDSSIDLNNKAQNTTAKLSIFVFDAMKAQELEVSTVNEYVNGASKQRAEEIINGLCELYSHKFRSAQETADDKEASKEAREGARRDMRACKMMLRRALLIGAYLFKINPAKVRLQAGDVSIDHDNDNFAGRFSVTAMETKSRKMFDRGGSERAAQTNTGTAPVAPGASLGVAAKMIANNVSGKKLDEFSSDTRKALQDALIVLLHTFAPNGDSIDGNKVVELYKKSMG